MNLVLSGALVGVIATLGMDLWALVVKHVLKLPTTDWAMIGRWVGHMRHGVFAHHPIAGATPIKNELALGWIVHYLIGIVYGLAYVWIVVVAFASSPTLLNALIFGIATVAAPWFVMQPGLGLGVFATRAPNPNLLRLIGLSMHAVFGMSLYIGWIAMA